MPRKQYSEGPGYLKNLAQQLVIELKITPADMGFISPDGQAGSAFQKLLTRIAQMNSATQGRIIGSDTSEALAFFDGTIRHSANLIAGCHGNVTPKMHLLWVAALVVLGEISRSRYQLFLEFTM